LTFQVIPAIDVLGARVVRLLRGSYSDVTDYTGTFFAGDVRGWVERMVAAGVRRLHVVDLGAARDPGSRASTVLIRELATIPELEVQLGGGIRSRDAAAAWLERGVSRVILGTLAVRDPDAATAIVEEWPGRVLLGVDVRGDAVMTDGWLEAGEFTHSGLVQRYNQVPGVAGYVYTNIERDGTLEGIDVEGLRAMVAESAHPVVASGGVAGLDDVRAARDAGAAGVILGRALYERRVDLREAIAAVQG
jgi:phosphoribosylformimino-5-aminoimidazole carboxamide ribotide isomerase